MSAQRRVLAASLAGGLIAAVLTACGTAAAGPASLVGAAPPAVTTTVPVTTAPVTAVPASTVTTPPPPPPPCAPAVRACVSLSLRQAWLMSGGLVEYGPVPISSGGPGQGTPTGTFPVSWKDADNTSSTYGTPMPFSVFFAPGGIAFHEGSVTEDSHGCVHLTAEAAPVFFAGLTRGQLVQVVR